MSQQQQLYVFCGAYAEQGEQGVTVYVFHEDTGTMEEKGHYSELKNPTFLHVDAERELLYAISETVDESGKRVGECAAFRIDKRQGDIELINRKRNVDATLCHIQRNGSYLTVTSYHGGLVGLIGLQEDGSIGELLDVKQHEGGSVDPERQQAPHPHSSFYSLDGQYLFVQDLGLDRIISYRVNQADGTLSKHGETELQGGAGPRHLAFHPGGKHAYVINELDSTVTVMTYDGEKGELSAIQTVRTLPEGYDGENGTAEIAVSRDGRFVYGSNRGHDSIVVFAVDGGSGRLTAIQHISSGGGHPRHFALTPNGHYLLTANRDSNNIVIYAVNKETGILAPAGHEEKVSKPVCVIPVYL
ncbi:lactonase family protein [Paenibacillus sp. J5C_2022]|uniref:lactonase family protein n=1 Tax=Paenibacillus sp. J5C2022 TaxID=2977129 RepID=UPI0021D268C8|nr:lactonase family protein [Paenibacillus sp. J5C2022]MCU6708155.1 lactonase family protein [Paenibacillus sp. J5C2022]